MSRRLRIVVDHGLCVGNAMCLETATSTFAHNDDRQSVVVDPQGDPEGLVLEAAGSCPVGAICVRVEETDEQLFPPTAASPDPR